MTRPNLPLWTIDRRSIEERFAEFDAQHPEVYRLFRELAEQLVAAGRRDGSADMIGHRIRWDHMVNRAHDGGFKLNNDFIALYARKLAAEEPRFKGFFSFRQRRAG